MYTQTFTPMFLFVLHRCLTAAPWSSLAHDDQDSLYYILQVCALKAAAAAFDPGVLCVLGEREGVCCVGGAFVRYNTDLGCASYTITHCMFPIQSHTA